MQPRNRRLILAMALLLLILAIGLLVMPPAIQALPGEYRVRLPEPVLNLVTTPLPDTLPAPNRPVIQPQITIPVQQTSTATPIPTLEVVSEAIVESDTISMTATPTVTLVPTATPTTLPTATPIPNAVLIEGVDIIPQGFNNCGPANLTQMLNYYGEATTQQNVAAYLKPNAEDRNVSPWQIADYVNEFTSQRAAVYTGGNLQLILDLLAADFPVVIEKGYEPGGDAGWMGHYLTVVGYDNEKREIYGYDTYLGPFDGEPSTHSFDIIRRYWQHFNYTFYVVYPPEREFEFQTIISEPLQDPMSMWEQAAAVAQQEIEYAPENTFAWFNLGTSLTRLGELTGESAYYVNAVQAFDQALSLGLPPRMLWYQFRPYIAYMKTGRYEDVLILTDAVLATQGGRNVEETYLYRGHTLALQGDISGASAAYERAIQLNENFYPARWALDSLGG